MSKITKDQVNRYAAEVLVEAGYAKSFAEDSDGIIEGYVRVRDSGYGTLHEKVDIHPTDGNAEQLCEVFDKLWKINPLLKSYRCSDYVENIALIGNRKAMYDFVISTMPEVSDD
jgi:hypothetical protein